MKAFMLLFYILSFPISLFAASDADVVAIQQTEDKAAGATDSSLSSAGKELERLKSLAVAQWTGTAQGMVYFKDAVGRPDIARGPQLDSGGWSALPASMSFQFSEDEAGNEHLYYLSEISPVYDKQIEDDAKGLCVNARPREVVLQWYPENKQYGLSVQLTKFIGPAADIGENALQSLPAAQKNTLPYVLYRVPLSDLDIASERLSFLSFLTMPVEYEKSIRDSGLDPNDYVMVVRYDMVQNSTTKTLSLDNQVTECLSRKPWQDFRFLSASEIAAAL